MSKLTTQTIATIASNYEAFLKAGGTYGDSLREAARQLGGTPCPTLLEALAKVHAKRYECNYTWNASGSAVFYNGKESTRETRNDSARKSWERNVMVFFKPEREAKPVSHARVSKVHRDAATNFLAEFEGKTMQEQINAAIAVLRAMSK